MKPVKAAIIGFGGIARAHNVGYSNLAKEGEPIELVAVCDINPAKFESMLKINLDAGSVSLPENIHTYTDVDENSSRCSLIYITRDFQEFLAIYWPKIDSILSHSWHPIVNGLMIGYKI